MLYDHSYINYMIKLGRNDKCFCNSGKKYKVCCLQLIESQKKNENIKYSEGHELSSEKIKILYNKLSVIFTDHKIIDITNLLNDQTYKTFQTVNYVKKTLMIAQKNDSNNDIFTSRGPSNVDLIVMYRGAYQCFEGINTDLALENITKMVLTRLNGQNVK